RAAVLDLGECIPRKDLVLIAQAMIEPAEILVRGDRFAEGGYVITRGVARIVRRGIKAAEGLSDGIDARGGNLRARKGRSRKRVCNGFSERRQVAVQLRRSWNPQGGNLRLAEPQAVVTAKEKRPVLLDRPAQHTAKLIPAQVRSLPRGVEKIARIQRVIAQKLEQRAMQRISSGLDGHIDRAARHPAKLGRINTLDERELLDCINIRLQTRTIPGVLD